LNSKVLLKLQRRIFQKKWLILQLTISRD